MTFSISPLLRKGLMAFIFAWALLASKQIHASHIVGADLTYTCLDPATNTYDVCLTVYRDAVNGVAFFDPTITIFIFRSSNGTLYTTQDVNLPAGTPDTLGADWLACTPVVPNIRIEYKKYNFQIVLPPTPGGYDLGWARCCRNNSITNINSNQGITVTAHVPGSEVPGCNSMPTFNQVLPIFLCQNQPFFFDHSATDLDGDSLVYQISNPFGGINIGGLGVTQFNPVVTQLGNQLGPPPYLNLNFAPTYSFSDPFGSGNFSIDPQSGLLTLTPTVLGISVFAVSVLEYRNGVLLSENKRDFQIQVISCSPQAPAPLISPDLSNINIAGGGNPGTGQPGNGILDIVGDTIFVLPTSSFCYDVTLQDSDPLDTVELFPVSAAFGIGGTGTFPPPFATLSSSGTNPVSGSVCWQVACENEGDTVMLIVGGRDPEDCQGYNLVFDTTYVVVVETQSPTISHTTTQGTVDTLVVDPLESFCYTVGAGDPDTFDVLEFFAVEGPFNGLGGSGPFATLTSTGTNPLNGQVCWTAPCDAAGQIFRFVIGVQDNNFCFNQAFDTLYIRVRNLPNAGIFPTSPSCLNDSLFLFAFGGTSYSWSPPTGLSATNIPNPKAAPSDTTTYIVSIIDTMGCPQQDTVRVDIWQLPNADAGSDTTKCRNGTVSIVASGGVLYLWDLIPGLNIYDIPNPIANPDSQTTYVVTVVDTNGCRARDSIVITPMYAVAGPDQNICSGDSVQLTASGGSIYSWSPTINILNPNSPNPTVFPTVTTVYTVTVTDSTGCTDVDSLEVVVIPPPAVSFGPTQMFCAGDSLQLSVSGGVSYQWDISPTLINGTTATPIVFPSTATQYFVEITDSIGCRNRDSVLVSLFPNPVVDAGADTVKCGGLPVQLSASGGLQYIWQNTPGISDTSIFNPLVDPDSNTTYFLTVIDSNGCSASDSINVRVWEANAGPDQSVCQGDTVQLQALDGVGYNWDPSPFLSNTTIADPLAFPTLTTDFFISITDTSGCIDRDTVRVSVIAPPSISFIQSDPSICSGDSTSFQASGGISYAWSPAALLDDSTLSNPSTIPLLYAGNQADTTYNFILSIVDGIGCRNTDTLVQTVRRLPNISLPSDTVRCPGDSVLLSASGGDFYAWTPGTFLSDPNIASPLAFPDSTTIFQVVVSDSLGCTDSASIRVLVNQLSAGADQSICINDSAQIEALGGVAFQWSPNLGLTDSSLRNPMASPAVTTTYQVIITDSSGCDHIDSVTVFVNPLPAIDAGRDSAICLGDSLQLSAVVGSNFQWLTSASLSNTSIPNPLAFPTTTTTYFIQATDTNSCNSLDSVTISVNPLPLADAGPDIVTKCGDDSVQLNASGGITYSWSPSTFMSNPNIANPMVAPDSNFQYVLQVTDANGCVNTDSVTVQSFYATASGSGTICEGEFAILLGTPINGFATNYDWQPDSSVVAPGNTASVFVNPTQSTTYILTITDSSGCIDTDTVQVEVRSGPVVDAGRDSSICEGGSIMLSASGGNTFSWTPIASLDNPSLPNPTATPSQTTTYFVEITDTSSCSSIDSVTITVNPLPSIDAGPTLTKCGDQSVQLQASGGLAYLWTPALGLSNDSIANPLANPDSSTVYTVTGIDANGCTNSASVLVNTFYALAGPDQQLCPDEISQMAPSFVGGQAVSYSWEPFALVAQPNDPNTQFSVAQDTFFVVSITDSSGCIDMDTMEVSVFTPPVAEAGEDQQICVGEIVDLMGSGGLTYSWTPSDDLSNPSSPNPTASPSQTTTYTLSVFDANNCIDTDSVTVSVNPLPVLTTSADTVVCAGNPAFISASGAQNYSWSPDSSLASPTSAQTLAIPEVTTTYQVLGTDSNGCQNTASVTLSVEEVPQLEGDPGDSICVGQSALLSVSGASSYQWSTGAIGSQIEVAPNFSEQFWVLPVNPLGCQGDTFFIDVFVERNLPLAAFTPDPVEGPYPLEVTFTNESQNSTQFSWYFGDGGISDEESPLYTYNDPGEYEVRLVVDNELGCPDESVFRFILVDEAQIVIPKAFTPNNDGINDQFRIGSTFPGAFNFKIFNRWGELIFEANDSNFAWDGTVNGVQVPEGVYVYQFEASSLDGFRFSRTGTITVMR